MEQIEECKGFKIIIIREESGKLIGAKCTYCTNRYPRKEHLLRHCKSAHVGLLQTSVSDPVNAFREADDEAEKQRLAALHVAALAEDAEKQRLAALHVAALAEAETQRLAALHVAALAEETEKQRLAALAEETEKQRLAELAEEAEKQRLTALHHATLAEEAEKQRLSALREKQRVLQAEAEKQRINAIKEAEEAEKQRINALKEAEEAENQRINALKEAEEAENQRINAIEALHADEAEKLYIKELQTLVSDKLKLCDDNDLDIDGIFTLETRNTDFLRAVDFFKNRIGRRKTERHIKHAIMLERMRAKKTKCSTNPSNNKTMRMKIRKMIL